MADGHHVSVILTVLNEAAAIGRLLDDLSVQDQPADEIVVVDGGSCDGTCDVIRRYPVRLIEAPGANISQGRNRAISEAQHDVIAVTDAGVRLGPDWLRLITAPLRDDRADMVAGFFRPDPHSAFERAIGATVLPALDDINPDTFLPSSRSLAFHKDVWRQVCGYPEWLDYCEDLIFDINARRAPNVRIVFEPRAVAQFRPRSNLRSFFRQYYRYARGDGKADLWRKRHVARYLAYAYLLAVIGTLLNPNGHPRGGVSAAAVASVLVGAALYVRRPLVRLAQPPASPRRESPGTWLCLAALVPFIRVVGDVAKMLGYPAGWYWRLKHHPPDWRQ